MSSPRRLSVVRPAPSGSSDEALRALASALAPYLKPMLNTAAADDGLVDVAEFVGVEEQRPIAGACRSGKIAGAAKIGRRWKAPRASVIAWLQTRGPRPLAGPDANEDVDELEELRTRLSLA